MKDQIICPICCSSSTFLKYANHDRLFGVSKKPFPLYKCNKCKVLFLHPMPSAAELSDYYPSNYISKQAKVDPRNSLINLLYSTYYSKNYSPFLRVLFRPVKHLLRALPIKKDANFLDVGCGTGKFLRFVKENGMNPYGVDPFIEEDIPQLNIKKIDLKKAKFKDNYFDFITLNNVLEHVHDPLDVMIECKRILKVGGIIIINVPLSSSLNHAVFGKNWVSLDTPRHLFLFSNKSLREISRKTDLKIVKQKYLSETFTIIGSLFYALTGTNKLYDVKLVGNFFLNIIFMPYSLLTNLLRVADQTEVFFKK